MYSYKHNIQHFAIIPVLLVLINNRLSHPLVFPMSLSSLENSPSPPFGNCLGQPKGCAMALTQGLISNVKVTLQTYPKSVSGP